MDDLYAFKGNVATTEMAERFKIMHDFVYWWLEDGW
jgi:hypothetical protein